MGRARRRTLLGALTAATKPSGRKMDQAQPTPDGVVMLDMRPNRIGAVAEQIGSVDFTKVTTGYTRLNAGDPTIVFNERS